MADEEADQESLSRGGGGCAAELQRLGERLQELERQLRESRGTAVEAATEYCQQLCQVRDLGEQAGMPPPPPSLPRPL
uniref:Zinc finger protein 292 n=1 Tax=Vombatus ursinus TaxID=29139 RepID=A0A4X2K7J1_VOMUR